MQVLVSSVGRPSSLNAWDSPMVGASLRRNMLFLSRQRQLPSASSTFYYQIATQSHQTSLTCLQFPAIQVGLQDPGWLKNKDNGAWCSSLVGKGLTLVYTGIPYEC